MFKDLPVVSEMRGSAMVDAADTGFWNSCEELVYERCTQGSNKGDQCEEKLQIERGKT